MKLRMGVLAATAALVGSTSTMTAQIRAGASIGTQRVNNAPMMLVGNPIPANLSDTPLAIDLGSALRERMVRVVGRDYQIVSREKMNDALETYGYPADALLPPFEVRRLILASNGTMFIHSAFSRNAQGLVNLSARFATTRSSDGAGYIVNVVQQSGESLDRLAQRAADALRDPIRAYADAKQCIDQAATDRAKARSAAEKALRSVPNYGLAEFCLGALAFADDSASEVAATHYRNALKTDSMAIPAYSGLAAINFNRSDTAATVATWQQVLRVEPTNQQLRDQAFELFRQFGRQEAAEEVADEGIRLDPNNADWYDLKSNSCLAQEKFDCAVHELERAFNVDSIRADTAFFRKITTAAQFVTDTSKFVNWAVKGVERYPDDRYLVSMSARAYSYTGDIDNTKSAVRKLMVFDAYDFEPLSFLIVAAENQPTDEAKNAAYQSLLEFVPVVRESEDELTQMRFGQSLAVSASRSYAAGAQALSAEFADSALATGMTDPGFKGFAGYFAAVPLMTEYAGLATEVRKPGPTCEQVDRFQAVVNRLLDLMRFAQEAPQAEIQDAATQYVNGLPGELEVANTLRRACR